MEPGGPMPHSQGLSNNYADCIFCAGTQVSHPYSNVSAVITLYIFIVVYFITSFLNVLWNVIHIFVKLFTFSSIFNLSLKVKLHPKYKYFKLPISMAWKRLLKGLIVITDGKISPHISDLNSKINNPDYVTNKNSKFKKKLTITIISDLNSNCQLPKPGDRSDFNTHKTCW